VNYPEESTQHTAFYSPPPPPPHHKKKNIKKKNKKKKKKNNKNIIYFSPCDDSLHCLQYSSLPLTASLSFKISTQNLGGVWPGLTKTKNCLTLLRDFFLRL
jgi:hypothetical protein